MIREEEDYDEHDGGPMAAVVGQKPVEKEESEGQSAPPGEFFAVAFERRRARAYQVDDQYEGKRAEERCCDGICNE